MRKYLVFFVAAVFLIAFWQWISSPMVVTVTGVGEVSVPATNAILSFSLLANDATAQGAIAGVKAKANGVRAVLKTNGISEEDIVESQVTVVPASMLTAGATGFQARINMGAKTVHIANIGNLISSLYLAGASVVSQPTLSVEKRDELEQKAVDEALIDAKKQASKLALKNWKLVKKIIAVSQQSSPLTSTLTSKADTLTETTNSEAFQNGVFKIVKVVSVSYKMW